MADFSALKTSIQNYIKQNGNNEITGAILQQILLSMVTALGDNAINDLVTALGDEVLARQNANTTLQGNIDDEATARNQADGILQQNINNEATARENADGTLQTNIDNEATARANADAQLGNRITMLQGNINSEAITRANADTELGGRITTLQGIVNGIVANILNGYVYAGIATPSTTPASGKVFYLALTAGTYTNFGATVVPQGINILKYNGTAWSLDSFLGLDDAPTEGSENLVKSGGVYNEFLKVKGQRKNYIDNFSVATNGLFPFDASCYISKEIPLVVGSTYEWNNGEKTTFSFLYARIYKSDNTSRYILIITEQAYSNSFTAQEGDVKAVFTFKKGLSGQFISCDGDVIWEKKEEVYGLSDEVSDITDLDYNEEAIPFEWITGKAIATDGTDATDANYMVSSFIPVQEGEQYRLTSYNNTQTSSENIYLNIAAYSAANVESFVSDALPFYFNGRFEQSIAVIIPKGVKYVRITGMISGDLMFNEWGCFHIKDINVVKELCGNNQLRYIGKSKQEVYINASVTIANRKYFNVQSTNEDSNSSQFAFLKVSAGDKFTINKVVALNNRYNTKFYDADKNVIKEYPNVAYTNRVIIAPEGAAWMYIAFDDNCYIGTIEEEKQDNNIENESVRSYLDDVEYDNNDYSYSFVKEYVDNVDSVVRKDQPRGEKVTWKKNENSVRQYATIVTDYGRHEVEISNSIDSYIAFNTIPNAVNVCKISAELSDQSRIVLASQKVQMDGNLRMIKADSLINIRDLGGWITEDGRKTKYNSIFRGCHPSKSPYQITEADRLMMVNLLGITVDVDLSETSGTQTESPFGEGVEVLDWDSIAVHWYDFATAEAIASSKTKLVSQLTALLPKLQNGDVLYMHCFGGADRTGVACMNIEAILGMQESDMLKDYELTSFSSYGLRERNDTSRDYPMEYVLPLVKAQEGATLSEKWINWLSDSGLTSETVTALRELMLT